MLSIEAYFNYFGRMIDEKTIKSKHGFYQNNHAKLYLTVEKANREVYKRFWNYNAEAIFTSSLFTVTYYFPKTFSDRFS